MLYIIYAIHVIICLFLIMVVLLQQGSGADLSVFGGGGTQTAFGARSATNLLHKLTVAGFVGFILTTIAFGFLKTGGTGSVMSGIEEASQSEGAAAAETEQGVESESLEAEEGLSEMELEADNSTAPVDEAGGTDPGVEETQESQSDP